MMDVMMYENSCYGGGSSYNGFSIVPIYTFALLSTLLLTVTFSQTLGTLTPCTVPWRGVWDSAVGESGTVGLSGRP
jgi:hypothetical protein